MRQPERSEDDLRRTRIGVRVDLAMWPKLSAAKKLALLRDAVEVLLDEQHALRLEQWHRDNPGQLVTSDEAASDPAA